MTKLISNDDLNISRKPHNICGGRVSMTDTDCLPNCPPSHHRSRLSSEWESLISITASLSWLSSLQISVCITNVSRVPALSRKLFSPCRLCAGACLTVEIPGGMWVETSRDETSDVCGNTERWSVEGGAPGAVSVWHRRSDSHPSPDWALSRSVLFCIIIIIIASLIARPHLGPGNRTRQTSS